MFLKTKHFVLKENSIVGTDPLDGTELYRKEFATKEEAQTAYHQLFSDLDKDPKVRVENEAGGFMAFEHVHDLVNKTLDGVHVTEAQKAEIKQLVADAIGRARL